MNNIHNQQRILSSFLHSIGLTLKYCFTFFCKNFGSSLICFLNLLINLLICRCSVGSLSWLRAGVILCNKIALYRIWKYDTWLNAVFQDVERLPHLLIIIIRNKMPRLFLSKHIITYSYRFIVISWFMYGDWIRSMTFWPKSGYIAFDQKANYMLYFSFI